MSRPILEVVALSAEDAAAAEAGGADRLEVVTDMAADGLTPSLETYTAVRDAVSIPLRVMLRLADGFSAGGDAGIEELYARGAALRAAGAEEFVLGFLDEAGQADLRAVEAVTAAVPGCRWTFHRALDRAADRDALRKQLADASGLDTYLTAGSPDGVTDGFRTLCAEAARTTAEEPGYAPRLLVGGGLSLDHVAGLRRAGIDAFHIGSAARPRGWAGPVDSAAVRTWRQALDRD